MSEPAPVEAAASHVQAEIASQPDCWRQAAATTAGAELPAPGARVAVIGCGTSQFVAQSWAARREAQGAGETDAFAASEFPSGRRYEHVVAISRSGTTTEVLAALDRLPAGTPSTAVTADGVSPIVDAADRAVVLDFADERSVVQTRFATSALVLLRAHLGEDLGALPADGEEALASELDRRWLRQARFTFLGTGWTVGIASEAALKLREASRSWTEAYPGMEFRHGPISVVDGDSVVWSFGPAPVGLADDVARTGAVWVTSALDPVADLVRAQRLAVQLGLDKGYDPDHPRHLSRSVILPGAS